MCEAKKSKAYRDFVDVLTVLDGWTPEKPVLIKFEDGAADALRVFSIEINDEQAVSVAANLASTFTLFDTASKGGDLNNPDAVTEKTALNAISITKWHLEHEPESLSKLVAGDTELLASHLSHDSFESAFLGALGQTMARHVALIGQVRDVKAQGLTKYRQESIKLLDELAERDIFTLTEPDKIPASFIEKTDWTRLRQIRDALDKLNDSIELQLRSNAG